MHKSILLGFNESYENFDVFVGVSTDPIYYVTPITYVGCVRWNSAQSEQITFPVNDSLLSDPMDVTIGFIYQSEEQFFQSPYYCGNFTFYPGNLLSSSDNEMKTLCSNDYNELKVLTYEVYNT